MPPSALAGASAIPSFPVRSTVKTSTTANQTQGLILNGVLRSHLQGQRWIIDNLKFHKGGTLELKGSVNLCQRRSGC